MVWNARLVKWKYVQENTKPFPIKDLKGTHAPGRHSGLWDWGHWRQRVSIFFLGTWWYPEKEGLRTRQGMWPGKAISPEGSISNGAGRSSVPIDANVKVKGSLQINLAASSLPLHFKSKACLETGDAESSPTANFHEILNMMEIE